MLIGKIKNINPDIVDSREEFLKELCKYLPNYNIGVEIGVLNGDFSFQILNTINIKKLYLIDPYLIGEEKYAGGLNTSYSTELDYINLLNRFNDQISNGTIIVDRRFSFDAVNDYPDNIFDFVYIDASHLYKDVLKDLNDWMPKLKNGGLMCGHDYTITQDFGVIKAVDEFMEQHFFEMILYNNIRGDFALRKNYCNAS